ETGFALQVRPEPPGGGAIAASHTDAGMVYAATPATSAPKIAASAIERIMTEPVSSYPHRARNTLASRTSARSLSAFLARLTSLLKYSEACARLPTTSEARAAPQKAR